MYVRNCFYWRVVIAALLVAAWSGAATAVGLVQKDPWAPLSLLLGEWEGEGAGKPGQGTGGFTFSRDLQGKVLIRKNYAEYPSTKDRPAFRHDDLMVAYKEDTSNRIRAIYFDSENHIINYSVAASEDRNSVEFLSDPDPTGPRYRLTYRSAGLDKMSIKFEIAPAGKPDAFATYIEATCRRKHAK